MTYYNKIIKTSLIVKNKKSMRILWAYILKERLNSSPPKCIWQSHLPSCLASSHPPTFSSLYVAIRQIVSSALLKSLNMIPDYSV